MRTHELLTALFPTRNRPHNILGQLVLFKNSNFTVLVADSSDINKVEEINAASSPLAQFLSYPPDIKFFDKLADAVKRIETPFVLLAADRKITFPHAAEAALAFLKEHDDYVAAQGYVIGFSAYDNDLDINRIVFFTPTIAERDPLQRHYHLMRRYQSWQFSVFRLQPLIKAIAQARTVAGAMFQEVMFMNALVLQGKVARLPKILTLQTVEESFSRLREIDPFYWFLNDSRSFFRHYARYRHSLARFISRNSMSGLANRELEHLLDVIHAVWLHYNFDSGVLNFATQQLLQDRTLNLPHPRPLVPRQFIRRADVVNFPLWRRAPRGPRRYIWRREVLNAEPKAEISIAPDEIKNVEHQLDIYFNK
jgi:glycosyltransferase domain-containing protein